MEIIKLWLVGAAKTVLTHPATKYIFTFALITGVLFTMLPLMNFSTGFQVGLIMGSYNYVATKGLSK